MSNLNWERSCLKLKERKIVSCPICKLSTPIISKHRQSISYPIEPNLNHISYHKTKLSTSHHSRCLKDHSTILAYATKNPSLFWKETSYTKCTHLHIWWIMSSHPATNTYQRARPSINKSISKYPPNNQEANLAAPRHSQIIGLLLGNEKFLLNFKKWVYLC